MKISAGVVAPSVVVLGTIGWLVQAYLEPPSAPDPPKPSKLEVADALLSPSMEKPTARNPFRLAGEVDEPALPAPALAGPKPKAAPAPADPIRKPAAPATGPKPSTIGGLGDRLRHLADALRSRAEKARLVREDLKAKVDGKARLSATSIRGDRRIAILNDKAYSEGEAIDWASGLAGPILVAEVRPASVVLGSGGARLEVTFPGASTATGPAPAAPAAQAVSRRSRATRKPAGAATARPR